MRSIVAAVWPLLAVLACAVQAADDAKPVGRPLPVCLVTGFEPFGRIKVNPSWEIAKALDGRAIAGYRVAAAQLPVVYDEIAGPLQKAIEQHRPEIVISLGVGSEVVQIETLARNGYHPRRPPDNKGAAPPRKKIMLEGKDELPTGLPARQLEAALKKATIGVTTSDDAGGYLCNECFYRLMAVELKGPAAGIKARGFVHVPPFGQPDPAGGKFTPEKLQKAVAIIIEETAKSVAKKDRE